MAGNFHEDYHKDEISPPSERSFGLVFTGVGIIAGVLFRGSPVILAVCLTAALALLLVSWLKPQLLRPLSLLWFRFGMLLHRVVNPIVMLLMYLVAILPLGLLMQIFRDPLRAKRREDVESYWVKRDVAASPASSMENQF